MSVNVLVPDQLERAEMELERREREYDDLRKSSTCGQCENCTECECGCGWGFCSHLREFVECDDPAEDCDSFSKRWWQ